MVTQIDYDNAVEKIRNNELDFSEDEIESLIDYGNYIDEFEGDDHRWDREVTTIIELDGKLYAIEWRRGLTEMQDNNYFSPAPYQVEKKTKMVEVEYYERIH